MTGAGAGVAVGLAVALGVAAAVTAVVAVVVVRVDAVVVVLAGTPIGPREGDHAPGEGERGERAGDDPPAEVGDATARAARRSRPSAARSL